MIRNTIFFLIGLLISLAIGTFSIIDYYRYITGKITFSTASLTFFRSLLGDPVLLVVIGIIIGFGLGTIIGVIVGHLIWPQV